MRKSVTLSALLCTASLLTTTVSIPSSEATRAKLKSSRGSDQQKSTPQSERKATRVAAGEYEVYEEGSGGAVGPFGEEVYEFHESWALSRGPGGDYRVEGERRFRTGKDKGAVTHPFAAQLSRELTVISITELGNLGPLRCEFLAAEMHCLIGGKKPDSSKDWHIAVRHPYGLLWPISPFSLGSVARESKPDPRMVTRASLISIEQPSADDPLSPMVLTGELQYLGTETFPAAGRSWKAYKFSIKVPLHPKFIIWTSKTGLLLGLAVEHQHLNWPKEGLRLIRYETFTDF